VSAELDEAGVLTAIAGVRDPELDQSIVDLEFVRRVKVAGGEVRVELGLPTYWCSPNFSWLMAEGVRDALLADPRVTEAEVVLVDHHAAGEISAGVSSGRTFGEVFGPSPDGELVDLRDLFRRKALLARQERALRPLAGDPSHLKVGDLPDTGEVRAYLEAREELGLDCSPEAPALTDAAGRPVVGARVDEHLRRARLMGVSIEGNAAFCRGLLATRYGEGSE